MRVNFRIILIRPTVSFGKFLTVYNYLPHACTDCYVWENVNTHALDRDFLPFLKAYSITMPKVHGTCNFEIGAFFFACEDFGRMSEYTFPACAFFFFFLVECSLRTLTPLFTPGSIHSGSASWDDCDRLFLTSCVCARFLIGSLTMPGQQQSQPTPTLSIINFENSNKRLIC